MNREVELESIARDAQLGRQEAWEKLYRLTHLPLLRLLRRLLRDEGRAEDLLQATFVTAIEHIAGYDPQRGKIDAWLVGIAKYKVLEMARKPRVATFESEPIDFPNMKSDVVDRELVEMALDQLEVRYAEVLRRKYIKGESLAAMSEGLQLKQATIGTLLHRARDRFRAVYERLKNRADGRDRPGNRNMASDGVKVIKMQPVETEICQ